MHTLISIFNEFPVTGVYCDKGLQNVGLGLHGHFFRGSVGRIFYFYFFYSILTVILTDTEEKGHLRRSCGGTHDLFG